jgi:hypothetical protein
MLYTPLATLTVHLPLYGAFYELSAVLNEIEPFQVRCFLTFFSRTVPFIFSPHWMEPQRKEQLLALLCSIDGTECWQEPVNFFHEEYNRFMTPASVARHGERGCSVVSVRIEV